MPEEGPAAGDVGDQNRGGGFTDIPEDPVGRVGVVEGVVFVKNC